MTERPSLLLTDLYQLTMLQDYFEHNMTDTAVFEFFVRKLPLGRNYLMAAGLEQVLEFLVNLQFKPQELDWMYQCGRFSSTFVDGLAKLRFTGDVDAMPEGSVFFPDEPVLRLVAPLPQAQLVETRIVNLLQYQTLVASKAARMRLAAPDRVLLDFGLRRAHGAEAGLLSARASYLAGFDGSSNVQAGIEWGIPLFGSLAHAYIQAHASEVEAFEHCVRSHPQTSTLTIDTYDTETAAHQVVDLVHRLGGDAFHVQAVRMDSGDLATEAQKVRRILDDGGLQEVRILASGSLDEYRLTELVNGGIPIDGFGIGTRLNTGSDRPYLDCAYKLQEYAGVPRRKRSEGKATWPGRKQVFRQYAPDGTMIRDILTTANASQSEEPLLMPVLRGGQRLNPAPSLSAIRAHAKSSLARLPVSLRSLTGASLPYPVTIDASLRQLAAEVDQAQAPHEPGLSASLQVTA